jgi:ferritin-like protein
MGTAGNQLIRGLDPTDLADDLDRFYCYEQVSIHWTRAVDNRLTGPAHYLLEDALREHIGQAERHASRLGARIAQLGGAITADPTRFVERSQGASVHMPDDTSDPAAVLTYALTQEQKVIGRYGQLLERVRGADPVTERLLVSILADKVAQEDEIESVLATNQPATR